MNLDHPSDFKIILRAAVDLGVFHTEMGTKKVKVNTLISILTNKVGKITCRRFHGEILNRAYGLAFINAKKMAWVRARAVTLNK